MGALTLSANCVGNIYTVLDLRIIDQIAINVNAAMHGTELSSIGSTYMSCWINIVCDYWPMSHSTSLIHMHA